MRYRSVNSFFAVLALVITVTLAAPEAAFAQRETPRESRMRGRDESTITRIVRVVRRVFGIAVNETITVPRPDSDNDD